MQKVGKQCTEIGGLACMHEGLEQYLGNSTCLDLAHDIFFITLFIYFSVSLNTSICDFDHVSTFLLFGR